MNIDYLICIFLTAGFISMSTGCQVIVDMDSPIAPQDALWTKGPGSEIGVDIALRSCGKQLQENRRLMEGTSAERSDFNAICMLKKDFKFVPNPKGYRAWCPAFKDSIACKSVRGEYKVEPDK